MARVLVGPVLADVLRISDGNNFTLASAFYSAARLDATTINAKRAEILVRLDLNSIEDWAARRIAPDALLRLWRRHQNVDIKMYHGARAHAKIYAGDSSFLVGSANFTVRGLSGTTDEVLWLQDEKAAMARMVRGLALYRRALAPLKLVDLEDYVVRNEKQVRKLQAKTPKSSEAQLPRNPGRPPRVGDYDAFLTWLSKSVSPAAKEVSDRADGKGQLSGHIRMNFYGGRQYLLAYPAQARALLLSDPAAYRVSDDRNVQETLRDFVLHEAADEGGLKVDTWRTYLPEKLGGKPKSGGGTIGNLNRMLPLLARYLRRLTP